MPNHATLSTNPARLLVADDDQLTLRFLADNLTADGYTVATAGSVGAARIVLERQPADLIVVDVNGNTLALLDALRAGELHPVGADTPVLVRTGQSAEQHRVRILERGADDLVLKPFSYPELRLRVAAVLRRAGRSRDHRHHVGPIEVDPRARSAWVAGQPVRLSRTEFSLLAVLASHPTQTFTRAELVAELWGPNGIVTSRALDCHAHRLRRRLQDAGAGPGFVQNVWGVGLRLADPSTYRPATHRSPEHDRRPQGPMAPPTHHRPPSPHARPPGIPFPEDATKGQASDLIATHHGAQRLHALSGRRAA